MKILQNIKEGYLMYAYKLMHQCKDIKGHVVFELAKGILEFYNNDLTVSNIYKSLSILESIEVDDLKQSHPELVSDLYAYLSLAYERLGYTTDAENYDLLCNQNRIDDLND
ncbi:MAG: hypothetical protein INQ03_17535 [Candidatus Heimdallarchaeota archaeon]|nr:hypothetical protein [Candidatus Heimdallarchaeota archaeon]